MPKDMYDKIEEFASNQTPPCKFSPAIQHLVNFGFIYNKILEYERDHKDDEELKPLFVMVNRFKDVDMSGRSLTDY